MPSVVICEDDARFRRVLSKALSSVEGLQVTAVGSGEAFFELLRGTPVDLLLLDLELPGLNGIDVLKMLAREGHFPRIEVLILTSFQDEQKVFEAMQHGAAGYLLKGGALPRLRQAIDEVLAGGTVIDARLGRRFWNYLAASVGQLPLDYGLSAEERDVLTLVARGLSNPEAAEALGASRASIKRQLAAIYAKLGVKNRVAAAVKALEAGLIEL